MQTTTPTPHTPAYDTLSKFSSFLYPILPHQLDNMAANNSSLRADAMPANPDQSETNQSHQTQERHLLPAIEDTAPPPPPSPPTPHYEQHHEPTPQHNWNDSATWSPPRSHQHNALHTNRPASPWENPSAHGWDSSENQTTTPTAMKPPPRKQLQLGTLSAVSTLVKFS